MSAESIRTVTPQAMRDRDAARALTAASGRTERTELSFTAFSSTTSGTRRKRAVATASVARACALLSAFDSRTQTPTGFLNDTAAARKKKKQRPDPLVDDEFVREVFLGLTTEQHRGACDAFVSRFFAARASQVARQDAMMYRVFAYVLPAAAAPPTTPPRHSLPRAANALDTLTPLPSGTSSSSGWRS